MYGYFVPVHQNSDELIPNPSIEHFAESTVDYQEVYFMLGIITARAICEKLLVDSHFHKVYLRCILGKLNGLDQLATFDPDLFEQLRRIKSETNLEDVSLGPCSDQNSFALPSTSQTR